jgi:purine-binding chemotaxis protein CheW
MSEQPAPNRGFAADGEGPSGAADLGRIEATLRARARQLARSPVAAEGGAAVEILAFRLGDETYAVDLQQLAAVQPVRGLTPVPCAPPYVAGLLNVRGEVVTVLDLARALELPARAALPEDARVLLVELAQGRVGLLVDAILGVERLDPEKLDRPFSGREFARGIAEARTVFLDLGVLLAGERFDVYEELN